MLLSEVIVDVIVKFSTDRICRAARAARGGCGAFRTRLVCGSQPAMGDPPPEEAGGDGEDQVVFELMDSAPVVLLAPQSPQPIIEHHPASNDGCFATRRNAAVERMTREAERMSTTARSTVQTRPRASTSRRPRRRRRRRPSSTAPTPSTSTSRTRTTSGPRRRRTRGAGPSPRRRTSSRRTRSGRSTCPIIKL